MCTANNSWHSLLGSRLAPLIFCFASSLHVGEGPRLLQVIFDDSEDDEPSPWAMAQSLSPQQKVKVTPKLHEDSSPTGRQGKHSGLATAHTAAETLAEALKPGHGRMQADDDSDEDMFAPGKHSGLTMAHTAADTLAEGLKPGHGRMQAADDSDEDMFAPGKHSSLTMAHNAAETLAEALNPGHRRMQAADDYDEDMFAPGKHSGLTMAHTVAETLAEGLKPGNGRMQAADDSDEDAASGRTGSPGEFAVRPGGLLSPQRRPGGVAADLSDKEEDVGKAAGQAGTPASGAPEEADERPENAIDEAVDRACAAVAAVMAGGGDSDDGELPEPPAASRGGAGGSGGAPERSRQVMGVGVQDPVALRSSPQRKSWAAPSPGGTSAASGLTPARSSVAASPGRVVGGLGAGLGAVLGAGGVGLGGTVPVPARPAAASRMGAAAGAAAFSGDESPAADLVSWAEEAAAEASAKRGQPGGAMEEPAGDAAELPMSPARPGPCSRGEPLFQRYLSNRFSSKAANNVATNVVILDTTENA